MKFLSRLTLAVVATCFLFASPPAFASVCKPGKVCIEHYRLNDRIDEDSVGLAIRYLHAAEERNATALVLELNTPGGSIPDGMELSKAIEESSVPVVCVVDGMAASMGAFILQSCPFRVMTKRSTLMFHQAALSGKMGGQPNDWQSITDELKALDRAMAWHNIHRMLVSFEYYMSRVDGGRQWWLNWNEALQTGAIDAACDTVPQLMDALRR